MKQLSLPVVATIIGSIAAIKELDGNAYETLKRDTYAITIQGLDGALSTVWVSKSQVEEYGLSPVMFLENIVSISVNKNIKDETYYLDADGDQVPHEETFDSFVNMINLMPVNMAMLGVPAFIIEDLTKRRAAAEANVPKKETKFHSGRTAVAESDKEAHIAQLKLKYDATTNAVLKQSIMARMVELGYVEEQPKEDPKKPEKVK